MNAGGERGRQDRPRLKIDVCIVAGRRPDLLRRTLTSFSQNLFRYFDIQRIIANIDPIFGSEADHQECVDLICSYDADAEITSPKEPGFCSAVVSNWSRSSAPIVLHLEDDWLLNRAITEDHLEPFFHKPLIAQIAFNHAYKNWDRDKKGSYCYQRRAVPLLPLIKSKFPVFTTSPSFIRGDFARTAATLMDVNYDPEKQFMRRVNPQLERFVVQYRNYIIGDIGDFYITDLGREWRETRGIEKSIVNAQSYWSEVLPAA